jgi:hypothetical protein
LVGVTTRVHRFAAVASVALGVGVFGAAVGGIASLDDGVGAIAPASAAEPQQTLEASAWQDCGPRGDRTDL